MMATNGESLVKYWGFHRWGYPNSWMAKKRENPTKMANLHMGTNGDISGQIWQNAT